MKTEDPSPHIFYCYLIFKRSHYLRNQHFRTRTHEIRIKNFSSWRCKIFLKLFCQQWSFSHQSRCCVRVSFLIGFFNNKDGDWLPTCSKISLFIPASLFLPDHRSFLFPPSFLSRSCHYSSSSLTWVFTRNVFLLWTAKSWVLLLQIRKVWNSVHNYSLKPVISALTAPEKKLKSIISWQPGT